MIFSERRVGFLSFNREFALHDQIKVSSMEIFIASLKNSSLSTACRQYANLCRFDWQSVKNNMISRFCRRSVLKETYTSKLRQLKFEGYHLVDEFLQACDDVYHVYEKVYFEDRSELRSLIAAIAQKLPQQLCRDVVYAVKSHSAGDDEDWELALPYDSFDGRGNRTTLRELIRSCARTLEIVQGPTKTTKIDRHDDRVSQLKEAKTPPRPSLEDWAAGYSKVYVVEPLKEVDENETAKLFKADEVKWLKNKTTRRSYAFAAYKNSSVADEVIKSLDEAKYHTRPFEPRGRRPGKGNNRYRGQGFGRGRGLQ
jgi:hypothetical protein